MWNYACHPTRMPGGLSETCNPLSEIRRRVSICVHVKESIKERRLSLFHHSSSIAQHVLFVLLGWFLRWGVSGRTTAIFESATSRICSKQHTVFMKIQSRCFPMCFVKIRVVQLCSNNDTATIWKKSRSILSERLDFHMIDNLSIAINAFTMRILTSLSGDEILLPRCVNWSTNFRWLHLV